jgi:ABC-type molybdate transport system substrate-binding protein
MERIQELSKTVFSVEIAHKGDLTANYNLLKEQFEDMYMSFLNVIDVKVDFEGSITLRRRIENPEELRESLKDSL